MQPEFIMPDFLQNNSAEEIHQRMMNNLPNDIDDMPGGFPYDFTKPAALEKEELINYHLVRTVMIAFPQYAWDEWLDLHGQQVHVKRHQPQKASGKVLIKGAAGTIISAGTVFCTSATDDGPSLEYASDIDTEIGKDGSILVPVTAVLKGPESNIGANAVSIMANPIKGIISVTNPEQIKGGTEREKDDAYFERIVAEYEQSMTYLGNDTDYKRWARQAGAGDCIVISAAEGPGTVKLVLVDGNGQPANEKLVQDVYNYIVSSEDRSERLLPTACAKLICVPATNVLVDYTCTGLQYDVTTDIGQIKKDFTDAVRKIYTKAKQEGILRYNDIRPLLRDIPGVQDFEIFLVDGKMENINLNTEEYPETGIIDFS